MREQPANGRLGLRFRPFSFDEPGLEPEPGPLDPAPHRSF